MGMGLYLPVPCNNFDVVSPYTTLLGSGVYFDLWFYAYNFVE